MGLGAIAGFRARNGTPPPEIVESMAAAVPHRGSLVEILVHGRCALACVNGAETTDAGVATSGGVATAFVGRLDNAAELAASLGREAPPAELGPAGLLAAGFEVYGKRLPERLRGVFAAVVTDGDHVHAFRDQLGYGLLFYRTDEQGFYAATEAKQVVAGAGIRKEPDVDVVERIVFNDLADDMPCALRGVRRLPKATLLATTDDDVRLERYWRPETLLETASISAADVQERFDELLGQAVSRCLTGQDVVSLSGGIDSPAVAAFAAPRHIELDGGPLQALTAVYPRFRSVDERVYVELLADRFAIPLHTYEPRANPLDDLGEWVALADGPYPAASLALYAEYYRGARERGFRTVLSGEHAEFVFALNWFLIEHLITHARLDAVRRQLAVRRAKGESVASLAWLVTRSMAPGSLLAARERRRPLGLPAWLDVRKASERLATSYASPRSRWTMLQLSGFIGPGISAEAEAVCQAVCGVQARRPWTDVDLFEFFLSLPAEVKFPDTGGKNLVRGLLRGRVPDEILDRRDRTYFNESLLADLDYATLRRYLIDPEHRFPGVDYELLADHLRREKFDALDFNWARQLATAHAFLAQW